ncbi:MAG: PAS domain S-box protein [bacterium]|nr:PAS domain S-box protein [bacterium]
MDRPAIQPPQATIPGALWAIQKADPVAKLTVAVFAVTAALLLIPVLSPAYRELISLRLSPAYFLALVVVAVRWRLGRITSGEEQRFWGDLTVAFSCWLAVACLNLFFEVTAKPFLVEFAGDVIYAVYYVALVLAVERQPHRRHRWRPSALERTLAWPAVTTFVFGLFLYFVLLPASVNRQVYASSLPATYLYLALDAYITIRLVYLCRVTRSLRWTALYLLLALAAAGIFTGDFIDYLIYLPVYPWGWSVATDIPWNLTFVFLVLAARLRHHPFPAEREPDATKIRLEENLPGPFGQTMIFALAFPILHFTFSFFSIPDEASRPYREALVCVWIVLLGAIAAIQHRILESITEGLRKDRARIEKALRNSERELRLMIERQRTQATVRASEEKFTKAFRSSPDIMAINSLEDGRFIEVNRGYPRFLGYHPDEILGLTAGELDLWPHPEDYAKVIETLREEGIVRDLEIEFRKKSGEKRMGLFSAKAIEIDGEACMLSIMCDISDRKREEEETRERAALLDEAQNAIRVVDLEDRIIYWNRSAERFYGWSTEEVIGRSANELLLGDASQELLELRERLSEEDGWSGELRQTTKAGKQVITENHWTLVCDSAGEPKSRLVISTSVHPSGQETRSTDTRRLDHG